MDVNPFSDIQFSSMFSHSVSVLFVSFPLMGCLTVAVSAADERVHLIPAVAPPYLGAEVSFYINSRVSLSIAIRKLAGTLTESRLHL